MKKIGKKIGSILLMLCLTVSCFSISAFAADGTIQFSDPSAKAGDKVTVKVKAESGTSPIGDVDMTVTYDTSVLKFVSGTNAAGGDGTLQLSATGDGTAAEVSYELEFTALKEGTATLQVTASTAYLYNDEALNLSAGTSTVTIQGGNAVTDTEDDSKASSGGLQVEVDGEKYTVNENFSEAAIPKGFKATPMELDGTTTKAMQQESSGQYMFYLEDSDGNSDYFLYSTDDGSFSPTAVVDVNADVSIYLMNHKDTEGLPSQYKETTSDMAGKVFTVWQDMSDQEYYLVYALSSEGNKGYYQYDSTEGTYQRYTAQAVEEEKNTNAAMNKVMNFLEKHLIVIMCAIWGGILLLLIIIIVMGVKLSHRNQELDELYDEYGIDDDGDDNNMPPAGGNKLRKRLVGLDDDLDDDNFDEDDFEDDDFEDDDFEDEYDDTGDFEEDEYYDDEEDYEAEGDFDEDDFEDVDDDFEEDAFLDEKPSRKPARKPARRPNNKQDDDYSIDFIDI